MHHRDSVYRSFANLFGIDEEAEQVGYGSETKEERDERLKEEEAERSRTEKWQWIGLIHRLAGGDPTKFEEVTRMNFVLCMNILSYEKTFNIKPRVESMPKNVGKSGRI